MVSDPNSRIPPSTFSFSPLIMELTVITVVIPITIPRIVSADRKGFFRRVSSASIISPCSFSAPSLRIRERTGRTAVCGSVFPSVAIEIVAYSDRNASTGSSLAAFEAG